MPSYRRVNDEDFLSQCRFEAFRGSGPGGQKRNKTSSAVRLTHLPTGMSATAGESRSQNANREKALRRLRHKVALEIREPLKEPLPPIDWEISLKRPEYLSVLGVLGDALAEKNWSVSEAAVALKITTAKLIRLLHRDEKLWSYVNDHRKKAGLKSLG
jgi:hypothetical protein